MSPSAKSKEFATTLRILFICHPPHRRWCTSSTSCSRPSMHASRVLSLPSFQPNNGLLLCRLQLGEAGMQALISLGNGDMRRTLNIFQVWFGSSHIRSSRT